MAEDYEAEFEPRLKGLHSRVQRGAYRPQPSRRTYIPKAGGKQRPLAIAALEDKIVQGAPTMVLNAVYEEDFLGFLYGFRLERGAHDALDALVVGMASRKVNYILDAGTHQSIPDQGKWLAQVVGGFFAYLALPTNFNTFGLFCRCVTATWKRSLQRRSQRADLTWERMRGMADERLPTPKSLHPWPNVRFAVKHSR